jgi:DNA replication protein DnaC
MLRWAHVPDVYAKAEWSKCNARKPGEEYAKDLAKYKEQGRGLIVMGDVGTGKSSLAGLLCGEALKLDLTVRWVYVPDLVSDLADKTIAREVMRSAVASDIEVWDDFGVGGLQGWQIGLLDRIVERRYQWNRPMIVTTNLGRKTLVENASPDLRRLVDRWREKGFLITMSGESMRRTWRDEHGEA